MSHVRIEIDHEAAIGTLTLDRPEKLNAFFGTMREEIADALDALGREAAVRAVIVTGAGRAFCAGADVGYLAELRERGAVDEFLRLVEGGRRVVTTIVEMPKPVIAAINGPAAGGGANLALACDLRIASERASIGQTFNRIGLHPDWGGTYFVPRLVGTARAAELLFLAEMVEAEEAARIGLVNRVVPHERLMPEAVEWARDLAARPELPLRLSKEAIRRSATAGLEEMLAYEEEAQRRCFLSPEASEGVRAFLEKRSPDFRNAPRAAGDEADRST
ncbi:MAG: enoyl-CoA hydratase/isomerase family protein [Gemmatimonadota bacterium]